MRTSIAWGNSALELEIDEPSHIGRRAEPAPNLADPAQAVRDALEHPLDYPALRQALTPDDHVAIVVDEGVPGLVGLLIAVLEHLEKGGVHSDAITVICPAPTSGQPWIDDLPDAYQDLHVEVHQPADRKKLAYLATTKKEHRIYLNRTAVDADQLIVLSRRRYDAAFGYGGAEMAVYPGLADQTSIEETRGHLTKKAPGATPSAIQAQAREVVWLLGAPFFVQVIEGTGDGICDVLAGPLESSDAGQRKLDERWRVEVDVPADVVVASVTGNSGGIDALARAAFTASRVVKSGGSIVLLSSGPVTLGPAFEMLRRHESADDARRVLEEEKSIDLSAGYQWLAAVGASRVYLLSGLEDDVAEELFAVPMQHAEQTQRLLGSGATCVLLPDADKTLAIVR